jgi:hypothetical protein
MLWNVGIALLGGVFATILVARLLNRRQVVPPAPQKVEVDVHLIPSSDFFHPPCLCHAEFSEADPEMADMLDELARRMQQFDASRSASIDTRRLEYVRYLVQTKRLSEFF